MPDKRPHILLIDDSLVELRQLIALMTSRDLRVSVAFNGRDGLHKAELLQPDLILLDINMPVMNGFATCRLLKTSERSRDIPVIFLSAANDADRRIEGLELGAVDFVSKPFHDVEVLTRVRIHLELATAYRSRMQAGLVKDPPGQSGEAILASKKDGLLVKTAVEYLRQHLAKPPSTRELASILCSNERRLNSAFQAHFDQPVSAWLREERLQQAAHFLQTTQTPVADLSEYLGFSTSSNFAKAFKERYQCSPREFRQSRPVEPGDPGDPTGQPDG
ncbi:response regulator [Malikia sp.]|uniref:response regulator transcription factor n=1 Tax=Malikia sp. TaxID=2070706 RepID=UPI0026066800|nr:response regulator [Malikia sp.]MDD2727971.1 response regulator [Malikia sp.]